MRLRSSRLHLPRYTVRLRLTLLYGVVFLVSGALLLGFAYFLVRQTTGPPVFKVRNGPQGIQVIGPHGRVTPAAFNLAIRSSPQALRRPRGGRRLRPRPRERRLDRRRAARRDGFFAAVPLRAASRAPAGAFLGGAAYLRVRTPAGKGPATAALPPPGLGDALFNGATVPGPFRSIGEANAQVRQLRAVAIVQHRDELHGLLIDLGIALAIMAIVSMGLGWFLAGRVLRPLHTITRAARAISATNLHRRLSLKGPDDELRELGGTFDELLERLERSFDAQRQFVANASHELRTPLTLERAIIEVALADPNASSQTLRETCERVLAIGEQQERMIEALLTLARSERGLERREAFDLARIAREVIGARRVAIAARGLRLHADLRGAYTSGDPRLVERLLANLLDNATRHNAAAGWVRVASGLDAAGPFVAVSNSGPVISPEDVDLLLEPFKRSGADRSARGDGHGLGLSIVRAITTAHGATLAVTARAQGGLDVRVGFPPPQGGTGAATRLPAVGYRAGEPDTDSALAPR
jgi:signal transduction histidine kinase